MPVISQFLGIIISMYYDEHNPPHFHASYAEYKADFDCEGKLLHGKMPSRQMRYIKVWAELHMGELYENWEAAREGRNFTGIKGLK